MDLFSSLLQQKNSEHYLALNRLSGVVDFLMARKKSKHKQLNIIADVYRFGYAGDKIKHINTEFSIKRQVVREAIII